MAHELGLDITSHIGMEKRYTFDLLPKIKKDFDICAMNATDYTDVQTLISEYHQSLEDLINKVLQNEKCLVLEGESTICGYDPMNMKKHKQMVYHKTFVGIMHKGNMRFIQGPAVTVSSNDTDKTLNKCYYLGKSSE